MVTVPFVASIPRTNDTSPMSVIKNAPRQFSLDALKHFAVFIDKYNVVYMKGQDVDSAALGVDVDTGVRLEAFVTDLHNVFDDRAIPAPWALPGTIGYF